MPLNLAAAAAVLKADYKPAIREQLNQSTFAALLPKDTENVVGLYAVMALHVKRNSGVGSRADGGTLPTAGQQSNVQEQVPLKYHYGRIKLTGPTMKAMSTSKGAFIRALDQEVDGLMNDTKRDQGRQYFGTSDGKIATCGTTSSSTTVQLIATTTIVELGQLDVDMVIDIGTVAAPTTVASARTITAIDETNKTITISGAAVSTTSGTHFIFRSGSGGSGASQVELTGLRTIVSDSGTLFNVDPSTTPAWKATVNSNSGTNRPATENLVISTIHTIRRKAGKDPNYAVGSDGVYRAICNQLTTLKRFPGSTMLKGGYEGVAITPGVGGKSTQLIWDRDAPLNRLFLLNTDRLCEYQAPDADWSWMDEDGAMLSRVSGEDAYEAVLFKYAELGTDQRNAHGLVSDLEED